MSFLRYLRLYLLFVRYSLSGALMFRINFAANVLIFIGWASLQIIFIEAIFSHTQSLAGWGKSEVYLLLAFAHIGERLFNLFFRDNLMTIPDLVTDGTLDGFLTKPVAPLFNVSVRQLHVPAIVNLYFPAALFWYASRISDIAWPWHAVLLAAILSVLGIAVTYATLLIFETLSFWFLRFSNIQELHAVFFRFSRYPLEIYGSARSIFFTIIPIAFTSYLPARALLGTLHWSFVVYAFVFASVLVMCAFRFWNFALQRYSSASS